MQQILAITWLTWKAALRFRLFSVIAVLLALAVVGLPMIIKDDGTAQGFTQIILTYTLTAITALLGLSTLWLSCGILARDIEDSQIQMVVTKPVGRWQVWLGKWLGIALLDAILLALSGACVFGLLQWRASSLPAAQQAILRQQVMVARGSAKPANVDADIQAETETVLQNRLKSSPDLARSADLPEVRRQILEQVKADFQLVPSGYTRTWQIDLGFARKEIQGKPLQLRIKFNSSTPSVTGTYTLVWQAGDASSTNAWQSNPLSLAPDTFHEITLPPNLCSPDGKLTLVVANPNASSLLFPLDDGIEVLYPETTFALNFARGLAIIYFWLLLMAAMGLMAASFLSFPVATFFALALMTVTLSSSTLAESVESGSVAAGNEETGAAGHSVTDVVLIPAFKATLTLIELVKGFSPIDNLSTGRSIGWDEIARAFFQIDFLLGGFFAGLGMLALHRRELASAQSSS